ncbi:hypothetical protein [Thioalkalivibrio sp. ALE31]|uniref:hypothetical protein n=1 Tax=Thioalkalivibrio sp. ALE31 TaxID=1158182 RepID=UPI00037AC290|nr:hypothetical protein [Thioalkalivibrio sp. ALE31]
MIKGETVEGFRGFFRALLAENASASNQKEAGVDQHRSHGRTCVAQKQRALGVGLP